MRNGATYRSLPATDVPHHLPLQASNGALALSMGAEVRGLRLSEMAVGLHGQFRPLSPL
jgi:hypothetical protein